MRTSSDSVRVRLRSLPPAAGLQWIRRGFRTFWRRPLGFIGLWLFFTLCLLGITVAVVAVSPLVLLAIAAFLPLLTVGFMLFATKLTLNEELRVVSLVYHGSAILDLDDPIGRAIKEVTVMTDNDVGLIEVVKKSLEPFDRVDIEMIRRLIEKQNIGS